MRLLSGEAMVAPLAERLDIPYPATDKSCGRVETSKDEGWVTYLIRRHAGEGGGGVRSKAAVARLLVTAVARGGIAVTLATICYIFVSVIWSEFLPSEL